MEEVVEKLVRYLSQHYRMKRDEAYSMIYHEWEYIEERVLKAKKRKKLYEELAKELIQLYMVA